MKILVIDDSSIHLEAARKTLVGHDITLCDSHDEAIELLTCNWDAVLCDLMMPAGENAQGSKGQKFIGEEMAVGWSLALTAASRGAKYVAVATDTNHHNHPASAMLDGIRNHMFSVDGARMLMTNNLIFVDVEGEEGKDWGDILDQLVKGEVES